VYDDESLKDFVVKKDGLKACGQRSKSKEVSSFDERFVVMGREMAKQRVNKFLRKEALSTFSEESEGLCYYPTNDVCSCLSSFRSCCQ
jgi:hypothetical protein